MRRIITWSNEGGRRMKCEERRKTLADRFNPANPPETTRSRRRIETWRVVQLLLQSLHYQQTARNSIGGGFQKCHNNKPPQSILIVWIT